MRKKIHDLLDSGFSFRTLEHSDDTWGFVLQAVIDTDEELGIEGGVLTVAKQPGSQHVVSAKVQTGPFELDPVKHPGRSRFGEERAICLDEARVLIMDTMANRPAIQQVASLAMTHI